MNDYKILKVQQPFIYSSEKNEYENFEKNLLDLLNSGYEIHHTENITSTSGNDDVYNSILFILRKMK